LPGIEHVEVARSEIKSKILHTQQTVSFKDEDILSRIREIEKSIEDFKEKLMRLERLEEKVLLLEKKVRVCPNCGSLIICSEAKFCGVCGAKLV
jgi:rubrerythrin